MKLAAKQTPVVNHLIRPMSFEDWPYVASVYMEGLKGGNATFETECPSWEEWNDNHIESCRLVIESGTDFAGWAALIPVSKRKVYKGVAEVSIYIGNNFRGKGFGKLLLLELTNCSELNGIWTLQAVMFPDNPVSVNLHKQCGFREVGYRRKIAKHSGQWRDTVLLERRSTKL